MATCVRKTGRWLLAVMMALFLAELTGCAAGGGPTTYPVNGRVVDSGGKSWMTGQITFRSVSDPSTLAVGDIQADGNFTLTTHYLVDGQPKTKRGAPPGNYQVTVVASAALDRGDRPVVAPVVLSKTYSIEARENSLVVETPRPGRR